MISTFRFLSNKPGFNAPVGFAHKVVMATDCAAGVKPAAYGVCLDLPGLPDTYNPDL